VMNSPRKQHIGSNTQPTKTVNTSLD
jgi:hypothetical protein